MNEDKPEENEEIPENESLEHKVKRIAREERAVERKHEEMLKDLYQIPDDIDPEDYADYIAEKQAEAQAQADEEDEAEIERERQETEREEKEKAKAEQAEIRRKKLEILEDMRKKVHGDSEVLDILEKDPELLPTVKDYLGLLSLMVNGKADKAVVTWKKGDKEGDFKRDFKFYNEKDEELTPVQHQDEHGQTIVELAKKLESMLQKKKEDDSKQ
jgi:hypothetical protein